LKEVGFSISEKSTAYANEWIVKNRLEGKVELFRNSSSLEKIAFPVTNMIVMAVKE
jgi:hypothetical protein